MSQSASVNSDKKSVLFVAHSLQHYAQNIFNIGDIHSVDLIKNAIRNLHSLRAKFPQYEKEVNTILFDLQKKSLSAHDDAIKQGAVVAFLRGFESIPVSDAPTGKNLIYAISEAPNLQYLTPIVQRMTLNLANTYAEKLKSTDPDISMARLLKDFVSYYYWQKKKKNLTDNNWACTITHTLAQIYPSYEFQSVADGFQYKAPKTTVNKVKLPEDPEVVYHARPSFSFNHLSREFDQN